MSAITWSLSLSVGLAPLGVVIARPFRAAADGLVLFLLVAEEYPTVYGLLYTPLVYVAYVLHRLHPFLRQWTFSSLPCLGCGRWLQGPLEGVYLSESVSLVYVH